MSIDMIAGVLIFLIGKVLGIALTVLYYKLIPKPIITEDHIDQPIPVIPSTITMTGLRKTVHTDVEKLLNKENTNG